MEKHQIVDIKITHLQLQLLKMVQEAQVMNIKKIEYDYYETFNSNEIKTQAVKAAIAKAMARNMSHNIGSHVLSNLVKDDIYDELKDVRVKKLNFYVSDRKNDLFLSGKNRQLAFFLRYLKSRMDYMSEVTFGSPSLLVNRMIAGDVMKEFDSVRILLNHISGIPGFRYKLNLKYGDDPLPLRKDDIAVAFPGDVIGCQAFYNIIENVIRNTAKHTMHQSGEKEAVFTICENLRRTIRTVKSHDRNTTTHGLRYYQAKRFIN